MAQNPFLRRHNYSEIPENATIFDVRSHGYYDPKFRRIKGSPRPEPNAATRQISNVPSDRQIIPYRN